MKNKILLDLDTERKDGIIKIQKESLNLTKGKEGENELKRAVKEDIDTLFLGIIQLINIGESNNIINKEEMIKHYIDKLKSV
jgi:hypothetical protein